jgi:hypothetical protein
MLKKYNQTEIYYSTSDGVYIARDELIQALSDIYQKAFGDQKEVYFEVLNLLNELKGK